MYIKDHRIVCISQQEARKIGRVVTPEIVVLHDTASRIGQGSAARYLLENDRGVSVHFVVERDGTVVQQVPLNRKANHAGKSQYHGRNGVNGFSIGIEIVNPGKMTRGKGRTARTWFKQEFDVDDYNIREVETKEHGHGFWMDYTEAQINTVINLLQVLFNGIETLTDIVAHWYISPGRKVDVNPLFPLDHIKSIIFGREDHLQKIEEASSLTAPDGALVAIEAPGDSLNMRRWPSFNPNVIAAIPDATIVPVVANGLFDGREWLKIIYAGQEGWVIASHTADITFGEGQ